MPAPAAGCRWRVSSRPEAAAALPHRRRVLIIVNPAAGGVGRRGRRLDRIVAALKRRGCDAVVRPTAATSGDAERLAREAEADFEAIVAAGGDGTLNAVVNGAATSAGRPVALLPFGTANVLAHEIGLPRDAERLADLIARGAARPVWPGTVGDRLFLTTASAGFDAEIVGGVDARLKRRLGRGAFAWAVVAGLVRYRAPRLIVRTGGAEYRAAGAIAAKGRCYAGRFVIAPGADLAEPMLDLVLLLRSGRLATLRYLVALLLGRAGRGRGVAVIRTRSAVFCGDSPGLVQADGEPAPALPVRIGIAEQPLWLIVP